MTLSVIMLALVLTGAIAWWAERHWQGSAKWLSLLGLTLLATVFAVFITSANHDFAQLQVLTRVMWIATFNIEYSIAIDQLSILLIALTWLLAIICVLISWREIKHKVGFYYFNLLLTVAGIIGVFIAVDLFLFFFFWEVMLLPMTAIIAIWGHENRRFAALKFFIFTQVSSLLMLVAIIGFAYFHLLQTGLLSFYYLDWRALPMPLAMSQYLMLGFFIAFAVKLPSVPVHTWLPDAHTQAPTAGSVLLAGVLLKTGAYGLIRFVIFLFPEASVQFAPVAATLAVVSILYGAKMAFAQQDFKRLIAYSSISHMGFVMLALFAFNSMAYQGAIVTMVAHGLSSAALFCLAGMIYQRIHSRSLIAMGGFWRSAPRMGGFTLAFACAAFGLPGLGNFIGEFLILVGVFQVQAEFAIVAALALVASAVYGMVLFQGSFQGPAKCEVIDLQRREVAICSALLLLLLLLGCYPTLLLKFSFGG
ncbi:NADH dehydrogenase subunit M [Colwellia chukchiensis]|uniref:NADH-quinone oxidoreductase subunit M n=1 Tax=Colwellia chukchiensis TaxID=641665 RepID=A0A1H7H0A5_9GAMM|nr:NADH-quinone oxidoreductase subunit M [Colwellia chukchiensis]SEK43843.1 NADH dehydrogenase subunit M [Colwellia chukchiensis]